MISGNTRLRPAKQALSGLTRTGGLERWEVSHGLTVSPSPRAACRRRLSKLKNNFARMDRGATCSFSRLYKCLRAKAIKTFTGGKGFGCKTTVQRGFNTQNKFAAELFCGQRSGQFMAVRFQNFNPLLDDPAELSIHLCLV